MPISLNDEKLTGIVISSISATSPIGFLKCNGDAINRIEFASLFSIIGTTYGVGDGSTTFNLPDLRGEFLRGLDDGRGIDINRKLGSFQSGQNQSHSHVVNSHNHGGGDHVHYFGVKSGGYDNAMWHHNGGTPGGSDSGPNSTSSTWSSAQTGYTVVGSESPGTNTSGGNESRPRNIAVNYFIKY